MMVRAITLFVLFLGLGPGVAAAQTTKDAAKASPAPVAATPERTTASFGDWVMRCEAATAPARRVCEVALVITLQGQNAPIAQVALGKPAATEAKRLTIVLPPNVAITTKPQIFIAKAGAAPTELSWQRCTPGACFASAAIPDETIAIFSAQAEPGRIVFKDATDREVALPISFRGLSQALAALIKE
jgi:invasion protein IalB